MLGFGALGQRALGQGSSPAASQAITGALFSNSNTFYGATLSATYTITGTLYSDADTFYAATVTPGSVTISGALFTDADTFFAATVSLAGAPQTIAGALVQNVNAFFGATVASDQTISGALYANDNTFYGATVSGGDTTTENFTSSGGVGTGWAPKTLSQLKREAERARRKARKKVLVALDRQGMLSERPAEIKAYVDSASFDVLALMADDMFINTAEQAAITAELMRLAFEYARQVADDEDLLLLAA